MFRSKGSRSMLTNQMYDAPRNLLFPNSLSNSSGNGVGGGTISSMSFISVTTAIYESQYHMLQQIHDSYTVLLANKKYEKISTDYDQYIFLLHELKELNISDTTLQLLIQITEDTLTGAVNLSSLYEASVYNELQILLLNKRIEDILSNKNVKHTLMEGISGQISIKKSFKLSPLFSYYIHLYGLPEYGVGFDPDKLAFIEILLGYMDVGEDIGGSFKNNKLQSATGSTGTTADATTEYDTNATTGATGFTEYDVDETTGATGIDYTEYDADVTTTGATGFTEYDADVTTGATGIDYIDFTASGTPLASPHVVMNDIEYDTGVTTGYDTGVTGYIDVFEYGFATTRDYTDFPIYQYNVSNTFEVRFDVRKFNSLLGLTKDVSNIHVLSSSYDISSDSFTNNSITLSFTDFFSQINSNTQISVGTLTNISTDFKNYVNTFYNAINSSTIYSFPSNFNPFNGVFDNSTFTSSITSLLSKINSSGVVSYSIQGVVVSGLDGNITVSNINGLLRYAVQTNAFGNRIPDSPTYSSYSVRDGFLADDLIYIPNGLKIILNVYFTYLTGQIIIISTKTYYIPLLIRLSNLT